MTEKCITNKLQYNKLLEILSERRDIAIGGTSNNKKDVNRFWTYVHDELNALGPPVKDASAWRKAWIDFKYKLKMKFAKASNTKGYCRKSWFCSLNDLEKFTFELVVKNGKSQSNINYKNQRNVEEESQEIKVIPDTEIWNHSNNNSQIEPFENESQNEFFFKECSTSKYDKLSIDTSSDNVNNDEEPVAISSSQMRRKNSHKRLSKNEDFSEFVNDFTKQETRSYDEIDHIAKVWAFKLKKLSEEQKILAEKKINDILFEAELDALKQDI